MGHNAAAENGVASCDSRVCGESESRRRGDSGMVLARSRLGDAVFVPVRRPMRAETAMDMQGGHGIMDGRRIVAVIAPTPGMVVCRRISHGGVRGVRMPGTPSSVNRAGRCGSRAVSHAGKMLSRPRPLLNVGVRRACTAETEVMCAVVRWAAPEGCAHRSSPDSVRIRIAVAEISVAERPFVRRAGRRLAARRTARGFCRDALFSR